MEKCQQAYLNGINYNLQYLLVSNKYYESQVVNDREEITSYLVLKYREAEKNIEVHAMKYGDKYNDLASKLGSLLSSALSLELGEMTETIKQVTYIFPKFAEKRLTWEDTPSNYKFDNFRKSRLAIWFPPHVLWQVRQSRENGDDREPCGSILAFRV